MSHEYSGKWCSLTTRYAIFLSFILVLSGSKMAFADWESFQTSPVDAAGSQTIRGFVSKPDGHFLAFNKEAAAQSINEAKTFFARYLD
jgi:hypothetical protein